MRDADSGRILKLSTRTVAQFLDEWFPAIQPTVDATTWKNWQDYAYSYFVPRLGGERLQSHNEPQLLKLYGTLLKEGRIKRDRNSVMFAYWSEQIARGHSPKPREIADTCGATIHAARAAVRRYRAGIAPKAMPPGLAPKSVRNIHVMIHRALVDAVAWKYISDNPASRVRPPKRVRSRRQVWSADQIQAFCMPCATIALRHCSFWN